MSAGKIMARLDLNPAGFFVAAPDQVGSTEEEVLALIRDGGGPAVRVEQIAESLREGAQNLHDVEPAGRC